MMMVEEEVGNVVEWMNVVIEKRDCPFLLFPRSSFPLFLFYFPHFRFYRPLLNVVKITASGILDF